MMDVISMNLENEQHKAETNSMNDKKRTNKKKIKRPDAANEVVAIEKKLGIKTDLLIKSNMYSLVGLILVLCGLSMPIFVIVGIIAEGLSIKVMLSSECKKQKLWHKCIAYYAKGMYNQAKVYSEGLPDEDKEGEGYKIFINMVNKAIKSHN